MESSQSPRDASLSHDPYSKLIFHPLDSFELYVIGNIHYVLYCVWLLLLNIMFVSCICIADR